MSIAVARGEREHLLPLALANRHGLIAGATGTGKTATLRVLAEGFSRAGVPVITADVKGDLAGLAAAGGENERVRERAARLGLAGFAPAAAPVVFWDIFGELGHPARTTVSDMGPLLLARLLGLNETQAGVLQVAFRLADDQGLLLLDLKDLRAVLALAAERAADLRASYGNVSAASVGAIQRALLALEQQGGDRLFGEPAIALEDLLRCDPAGRGVVNVIAAEKLVGAPRVYATFLLWLLAELFEGLPETGDAAKPRLVFFFDEAHLLFDGAPPALREKVEQVVRLIRSKGVGIYFVTQSPLDLPDEVLGQLGHRVQHALRAFTPRDQKAVRAAAQTFRANPGLDVAAAIGELAVGEALVSLLDGEGRPGPVDRALVYPPGTRLGPLSAEERRAAIAASPLAGRYERAVDRESAFELLRARAERAAAREGEREPLLPPSPSRTPRRRRASRGGEEVLDDIARSAARGVGYSLGRALVRGLLGSLTGGGGRRRRR